MTNDQQQPLPEPRETVLTDGMGKRYGRVGDYIGTEDGYDMFEVVIEDPTVAPKRGVPVIGWNARGTRLTAVI